MDDSDGWDWRWLYFAAIYIFRLPEDVFWRMTPIQLETLSSEYENYQAKQNGDDSGDSSNSRRTSNNQPVYIDQLW